MNESSIGAYIHEQLAELIAIRHDLHAHPELSYEEHRTSEKICNELDRLGIAYKRGYAGGTGVVAFLPATCMNSVHESVGLRADIDALPIEENTGCSYASQTPGVMHACGHDGHTAVLLGAARVLAALDHRPNAITLIFQPAEENGGGGEKMCQEGVLLGEAGGGIGLPVGRIFGLHGWPEVPLGVVASRPGALLAATDDFVVKVTSEGGHAAFPHLTTDPILAAAHMVTSLQSIASRNIDPVDACVVTVGQISGGVANNVIPTEVELVGTIRTLTHQAREIARQRFFAILESTAAAHGCRVDIDWQDGYPATINDSALTERFFEIAQNCFGSDRVARIENPVMGGEDFSYYGQHVPACFYMLGLLPQKGDPHTTPKLHQAEFDFNDDAIATGVEMMVHLGLAQSDPKPSPHVKVCEGLSQQKTVHS